MNTKRDHLQMARARLQRLDNGDRNYQYSDVEAVALLALADQLERIADLFERYLRAEWSARAGVAPVGDVLEAWNAYTVARLSGNGLGEASK